MRIFHYTSLESVKCILKNHTIRLTALNKMDDLLEGLNPNFVNVSEHYYVSSWTDSSKESIPLWYMYTNKMKGIRIEADSDFLELKENPRNLNIENVKNNNACVFRIKYGENDNFLVPVKYSNTVENSISGLRNYINDNFYDIGRIKPKSWEFQKEVRFRLYGGNKKVINSMKVGENLFKKFMTFFINKKIYKKRNDIEYVDIEFDIKTLKNANFLVGPLASDDTYHKLVDLVNKNIPNFEGKIEHSKLKVRYE